MDYYREARDPLVVRTEPLSRMTRAFVEQWRRERPPPTGDQTTEGVAPIGAVRYLAAESGLSVQTIRRVIEGRSETTEYRIAEPLVHRGLERPEVFHNGELSVFQNDKASPSSKAERLEDIRGAYADGTLQRSLNGSAAPPP